MTRFDLVRAIVKALAETQEQSGRQDPGDLGEEVCPLRDIEDFDSLNAVEATVLLERALGLEIARNIFVDEEGKRPLTVGEVADRLAGEPAEQGTR